MTVIKKKSAKREISKRFEKAISKKGIDNRKYCGVIKLNEDPLLIQKRLRDEWE